MHELAITQDIIEIVTERAGTRRIKRVVVEIGMLSCVAPDALRFNFEICSEGTVAENALLEVEHKPGRGRCRRCASEVEMKSPFTRCDCGADGLKWLSGHELRIRAMEVI